MDAVKEGRLSPDENVHGKKKPHGLAEPSPWYSCGTPWGMRSARTFLSLDIFMLSKVFSLSYHLFIAV